MSASSPRGHRGGSAFRGARGSSTAAPPNRGNTRGSSTRGRGRGRGASPIIPTNSGGGLLQQLRSGSVQRGVANGGPSTGRGRGTPRAAAQSASGGRGHLPQTFNNPARQPSAPQSRSASPAPSSSVRDFMNDATSRFHSLKQHRDQERARAIRDGFLADPEKKTTLDKAITPVGTSTEMCPEFERVERMVQNMVDKCEKVKNEETGRDMPSEPIMVKRFRRSAAGYDEQLPSDIRTPATLERTTDYLMNKLVGGTERLAVVHKFVWDRTRAIRNDFSIQQVSKEDDVQKAVACYERIARFHILSMHQLSNPDNLLDGENFDFFQEREQLNNTLISLMFYYDDNRDTIDFPNEAEFRAYCVIFEIQSQHPDLEDRMQSWPNNVLQDRRVETALKLYRAAGNTIFEQGPLKPMAPYSLAHNNSGAFWTTLSSSAVPYLMACVAEIYFPYVRFAALDALWKAGKSAPQAHQAKTQDWTQSALTDYLGFDTEEQTVEFCRAFDLSFDSAGTGTSFLNLSFNASASLDKSKIPRKQTFSHTFVEDKRCRRSLAAVINGMTVADAIRAELVEEDQDEDEDEHTFQVEEFPDDDNNLFIPETNTGLSKPSFGSGLNAGAALFTVTKKFGDVASPAISTKFGEAAAPSWTTNFGASAALAQKSSIFGQKPVDKAAEPEAPSPKPPVSSHQSSLGAAASTTSPFSFSTKSPFDPPPTTASSPSSIPSSILNPPSFSFGKPLAPSTPSSHVAFSNPEFPKAAEPAFEIKTTKSPSVSQPLTFTPLASAPTAQPPTFFSATPTQSKVESSGSNFKFDFQAPKPAVASSTATQPAAFSSILANETPFAPSANPLTSKSPFNFQQAKATHPSPTELFSPASIPPQASPKFPIVETVKPLPSFTGSTPSQPKSSEHIQQPFNLQSPAPSIRQNQETSSGYGLRKAASPTPVGSTTPPISPKQQPVATLNPQPDKFELVHNLAKLSFCQQGGLLQEYLEYTLPKLLAGVVKQHNQTLRTETTERLRRSCLLRKYGAIWRRITWRNSLNRKAKARRQRFNELLTKEAEKRKKLEREKDEILKAVEEKKQLQAEMKERAKAEELLRKAEGEAANKQTASQKRKSLSDNLASTTSNIAASESSNLNHKRSRTLGSPMAPPPWPEQMRTSASSPGVRFSSTSLGASLSRSSSSRSLRRSLHRPIQDNTQTDFFRLVAAGVDPETPWIPLTTSQVKEKEKRDAVEKATKLEATYNRRKGGATQKDPHALPQASPMISTSASPRVIESASPAPSSQASETDDLIRQLREVRQEMDDDISWFKEQNERMQQEVEEEEALRSSASSYQSGRTSLSGLPMVNGYEYWQAPNSTKMSMSRVERRIRATGARGFANRPYGQYAVAMSKQTARKQMKQGEQVEEIETNGTAKKRRKHRTYDQTYKPTGEDALTDEEVELEYMASPKPSKAIKHSHASRPPPNFDLSYKPSGDDDLTQEEESYEYLAQKSSRKIRHNQPQPRSATAARKIPAKVAVKGNPYDHQQNLPIEDEDDDEEILEDGEDNNHLFYHNGEDGDTEELYDDEEEELVEDSDESEDGVGYDDDPRLRSYRGESRPYEDAPTPNTQTSHVSSGVGATAEDPLELSD